MELFKSVKKACIVVTYAIVLYLVLANLHRFNGIAGEVASIALPVILGFCIAYALNLPMRVIEARLVRPLVNPPGSKKERNGLVRSVSILLTFLLTVLVITMIVLFVVPQVTSSFKTMTATLPIHIQNFYNAGIELLQRYDISQTVIEAVQKYWNEIYNVVRTWASQLLGGVIGFTAGITSAVTTGILSTIMAVYMLSSKEKMSQVLTTLMSTYVPKRARRVIMEVLTTADQCFSKFISGQVIEAFVLGFLCFIGMSLLGFRNYPVLISVFVGATGLIPMFGAFIGAAVGAFLIAVIDPIQALLFLLFIVVLQQFEGNVVYPRVVGTSIGLKGIYVMFAIIIGGNLWGFAGMVLGIPLFATAYRLIKRDVEKRRILTAIKEEKQMQ